MWVSLIEIIFWQTRHARALLKRAEQQKRVWPLQVWELVCCLAVRSPFYLHGLRSACCQLFTRVFRFPISHTTKLNWNEYIRPGGRGPSGSGGPAGRGQSLLGNGPSTSNSGMQNSSNWGRSGPSAPRPPILSQPPNIGVSPFGGGNNMQGGSNSSGFGNNQSSQYNNSSDRFDAYKPMMNNKRY